MNKVRIVNLTKIEDRRGNLSIIEELKEVPFAIQRAFWIYDVPGGQVRGGHAYRKQQEFIIALSGSFDVVLDDGSQQRSFQLNRSYYGLYVPNMVWREMVNFSTNAVALLLSSSAYDVDDYIRNKDEFLDAARNSKNNRF